MRKAAFFFLGVVIVLYCLFPFLWTVITAVKPPEEVFSLPIRYLPRSLSVENFVDVFYKRPFSRYIINSLIVATGGTILTLALASVVAFKLRYMSVQRALMLQRWLLVGAILPPTLLVIPVFVVIRALGLINNPLGLILSYSFLNLPFGIWMLYAAFSRIPKELDEAAMIDGLWWGGILLRVILPLARAALAVSAALIFIFCWNEFLIALTLMPDQLHYTVPVGISMLSGASIYEIPWGQINAAVTITTVPVILIVALLQRWIVEGLTAGAVKG
ncbi:MAG: carbohydrate ABC transporter permease [Deltaproteobacteria bacterium]|nr:MAG: carbohydrate ABC transporter permease [Deltaproteobacteria bacterium]